MYVCVYDGGHVCCVACYTAALSSLGLSRAHFTPQISGSMCEKQPGMTFIIQRQQGIGL